MKEIDAGCKISVDEDKIWFESDSGTMVWAEGDVFGADWKDTMGIAEAAVSAAKLGGEVVQLCCGDDNYWFTSMFCKRTKKQAIKEGIADENEFQ
jgi:hypothetical protein